ncbi:MAG TPA: hypothetical protein VG537_08105 [Candidatus Kapabacteria bacterium]|jgi:hypothetical protein|nr:hypothetical protein [Candidatus Kapabacteria bacterium]
MIKTGLSCGLSVVEKESGFQSMNAVKAGAAVFLLVMIAINSPVQAQPITLHQDTVVTRDTAVQMSKLGQIAYVLGASVGFSLGDYIAFNVLKDRDYVYQPPRAFRIIEGMTQVAITYLLYHYCGLSSAISFNLMWWTWVDDFAYYAWGYTTNLFPWESSRESGLRFNEYTSAGWTPLGLLRPQGSAISKSTLLAQSAAGFSISMAILLW